MKRKLNNFENESDSNKKLCLDNIMNVDLDNNVPKTLCLDTIVNNDSDDTLLNNSIVDLTLDDNVSVWNSIMSFNKPIDNINLSLVNKNMYDIWRIYYIPSVIERHQCCEFMHRLIAANTRTATIIFGHLLKDENRLHNNFLDNDKCEQFEKKPVVAGEYAYIYPHFLQMKNILKTISQKKIVYKFELNLHNKYFPATPKGMFYNRILQNTKDTQQNLLVNSHLLKNNYLKFYNVSHPYSFQSKIHLNNDLEKKIYDQKFTNEKYLSNTNIMSDLLFRAIVEKNGPIIDLLIDKTTVSYYLRDTFYNHLVKIKGADYVFNNYNLGVDKPISQVVLPQYQYLISNVHNLNSTTNFNILPRNVIELLVSKNGMLLQFINNQDEAICIAAIKNNWKSFNYVKIWTRNIHMTMVAQNGLLLQYIKKEDQDQQICIWAITNNSYAYHFVKIESVFINSFYKNIVDKKKKDCIYVAELEQMRNHNNIKFLDINQFWNNDQKNIFQENSKKYFGNSKVLYYELHNLNQQNIDNADMEKITMYYNNLGLKIPAESAVPDCIESARSKLKKLLIATY
jgi:hypothetical protein